MKNFMNEIKKVSLVMSVFNFVVINILFIKKLLEFTFKNHHYSATSRVTENLICSVLNGATPEEKSEAVDEFLSVGDKFIVDMKNDPKLSLYISKDKLISRIVDLIEKCNRNSEMRSELKDIVMMSDSFEDLVALLPRLSKAYIESGVIEETEEIIEDVVLSMESKKDEYENLCKERPVQNDLIED